MIEVLFYAFLLSLLIGTILTPCLMLGARRFDLLDQPGHRKVHKQPIARVGGIAFAVGALVSIGFWIPKYDVVIGVIAASILIVSMGSLDDFLDLQVRYKFGGQFLAAGVVATYSQLSWQPFSMILGFEFPDWLAISLTMFLLVAVTNAMNLSDGLDGLAGGLSLLSFGLIVFIAYNLEDHLVLLLTVPVIGGLLGFLRFNTFPARVFMGDGGSQFLGFAVGTTALLLTQPGRSSVSPMLVLFCIGVPLLDLVAVATQRILERRSPFYPDQEHLHHKLLRLGFSHDHVVLLIYFLQICLVGLGYVYQASSGVFLASLYLLILAAMGVFYYFFSTGRLLDGIKRWRVRALYWQSRFKSVPWFSQTCLYGLTTGVVGFLFLGILLPHTTPLAVSYLALGLALTVFLRMLGNPKVVLAITRISLFLGSTLVLYLVENSLLGVGNEVALVYQIFFGILVLLLLLNIHLNKGHGFQATPMDYLLLFLALVMPFLLGIQLGQVELGSMIAKLIVLFFACEFLLQAYSTKTRQLGYLSGAVLLGFGLQGWY